MKPSSALAAPSPPAIEPPPPVVEPPPPVAAVPVAPAEQGPTVYVTATGEKYHRAGCSSLSKSKIAMSLSEAGASGYTPCKRCRP